MARMEIREIPNIGTAIIPRVVCVGGFAQFYGEIANNPNLPKKVSRKARRRKAKKAQPDKPTPSVVVMDHFKQEETHIVRQSCKGRFRELGTCKKTQVKHNFHGTFFWVWDDQFSEPRRARQPHFKGVERNYRRKPVVQLTA